jgi:hypothetical protein
MEYEVSLQTISWFNQQHQADSLEISAAFQRRAVWLEKERSALLKTVFDALPFPEVYVHTITTAATGAQKHVVVDGQQRITSVLMFIAGEVALPDDIIWKGQRFSDLSPVQQEHFWDYKVVVRFLRKTNDAEIRELFTRLNTNNVALNDQELRNARYQGKFKQCAERLADNSMFQEISLFTAREVRRMEDIEFVSELLMRTVAGITNKKDMLEELYADLDEEFPGEADYESKTVNSLALLRSVISPENVQFVRTKSNFYSLFGACLEFFEKTKRTSFKSADAVATALTDLLTQVKVFDPAVHKGKELEEYYNAVSRAASDKGRRVTREKILLDRILTIET